MQRSYVKTLLSTLALVLDAPEMEQQETDHFYQYWQDLLNERVHDGGHALALHILRFSPLAGDTTPSFVFS